MLVFVPTREDVLAIRSIEEAFDLWTSKVTRREVALIRVALAEGLVRHSLHAEDEADQEDIPRVAVDRVIASGAATSKDIDQNGPRQVGINFEGTMRGGCRIRVKVSWDRQHYVATVHSIM